MIADVVRASRAEHEILDHVIAYVKKLTYGADPSYLMKNMETLRCSVSDAVKKSLAPIRRLERACK